jgi:hypothetical protein
VKHFLVSLFASFALCSYSALAQSAAEIQQAIREIPLKAIGDFPTGVHTVSSYTIYVDYRTGFELCVYGCDPFPKMPLGFYEGIPIAAQQPSSNQAMQLTAPRRVFSLVDTYVHLSDFDARFWWP